MRSSPRPSAATSGAWTSWTGDRPAQRLSDRGHVRAVAVATNAKGDALVAWDLRGALQARLVRNNKPGRVHNLAKASAAEHLSVALTNGRHSVVTWIDQRSNEGETAIKARVRESLNLGTPRTLEAYLDVAIPGGPATAMSAPGSLSGHASAGLDAATGEAIVLVERRQRSRATRSTVVPPAGASLASAGWRSQCWPRPRVRSARRSTHDRLSGLR